MTPERRKRYVSAEQRGSLVGCGPWRGVISYIIGKLWGKFCQLMVSRLMAGSAGFSIDVRDSLVEQHERRSGVYDSRPGESSASKHLVRCFRFRGAI